MGKLGRGPPPVVYPDARRPPLETAGDVALRSTAIWSIGAATPATANRRRPTRIGTSARQDVKIARCEPTPRLLLRWGSSMGMGRSVASGLLGRKMAADSPEYSLPAGLQVRFLGLVASVGLLAIFSSAATGARLWLFALVIAQVAVPTIELVALRWSGFVSEAESMRKSFHLLLGLFAVFAGAYGESRGPEFPVEALIVAVAAIHLVACSLLWGPLPSKWSGLRTTLIALITMAAAALVVDAGIGWSLLPFACYGIAVSVATARLGNVRRS